MSNQTENINEDIEIMGRNKTKFLELKSIIAGIKISKIH